MAFYVFDLDGTLADCSHRLHYLDKKDWRGFFAACPHDEPINHMIELFVTLCRGGHRVEIWSGRSDEVRAETEAWLLEHDIGGSLTGPITVLMRNAGDHRPDDEVKREFLRGGGIPDLIFDDRKRVVDMWRAEGIPCAHIAEGDF